MAEKKKTIIGEFKEFISRGNVMDMAVGVIIGGAFTKIVNSVVSDIITPALGLLTGNVDFSELAYELKPAELDAAGEVVKEALTIRYGVFLDALINFFLIAICVFLMVKAINTVKTKAEALKKKEEEEAKEETPAPEPTPDPQLELLTEIRDLLKK